MGLFDRFRSTRQIAEDSGASKTDAQEQEATRLIKEGRALEEKGTLDEAMRRYLKAIQITPNLAKAHLNYGNVLLLKGNLQAALDAFRTAIKYKPDYAGAHCAMGFALKELGQLDSAVACFQKALLINPNLTEAQVNLDNVPKELFNKGNILAGSGQQKDAVKIYQQALKIKPDFAEAHCNLGLALQELGQLKKAVASFRRTLEIKPDLLEAHYNLGVALQELGQLDNAVASYQQALEIKPNFFEAHCNLGVALKDLGQLDNAVACYRRAINIQPNFFDAHNNLGLALKDLGKLDDAVKSHRFALKIKPDSTDAFTNQLFILNYTASHASSHCLEQARQYGQMVAKKVTKRFSAWQCASGPERLRVGLVSGDLLNHPVGLFLEGLLANINHARIELIAYSAHHKEDELTARIRPYFSVWKPLFGKSDEVAAHLIHNDGVHVLLDLSGHTAHNRLPVFAWKPAPVQASWLGYFATTGVAEIDYLLADEVGVPEAQRQQFTESIWYLPDTRLCFTVPKVDLPVAPLPAIENGYITFGCFQNLSKASDGVLESWGNIFAALPNAKLRIQCKQLNDSLQAEQLLQRLQRYGIGPVRVRTHGSTDRETYLAAHAEVDIILDTFPYPGGTTTCEALWMGVPTLTLAGDSLLERQGASLLMAAGLEEWVAASKEEYLAKAIRLAGDLSGLAALRAGLRQQVLASPLFDASRFARNFEEALWGMWQSYQAQQKKFERL